MSASRNGKRTYRISKARRSQLVLQGRYMGIVRHLTGKNARQIKAVRARFGLRVAIAKARALAV